VCEDENCQDLDHKHGQIERKDSFDKITSDVKIQHKIYSWSNIKQHKLLYFLILTYMLVRVLKQINTTFFLSLGMENEGVYIPFEVIASIVELAVLFTFFYRGFRKIRRTMMLQIVEETVEDTNIKTQNSFELTPTETTTTANPNNPTAPSSTRTTSSTFARTKSKKTIVWVLKKFF